MKRNYLTALVSLGLLGFIALPVNNAFAQQKTAKQCSQEYAANKDAIRASGQKKADFIADCRAGKTTSTAAPPAAPATPPKTTTSTASAPAAPTSPPAKSGASGASTATLATGQFATESQAKAHCPADTVVWANLNSKVYHFSSSKDYGNTKRGAYMCEKDTAGAGFRAAKNEKHP